MSTQTTTSQTLDAPWLNDTERNDATHLLARLDALREERGILANPLTELHAEDLVLSRVLARRLEQQLFDLLDRPGTRIPGAFVDAVGRARDRYRKALANFEETHPAPPESDDPNKRIRVVHPVFGDEDLVREILDIYAPDLEPFEDLSVTGYFLQKYKGPEPKFELPSEAYQNIQRVPGIGHPCDPITGERFLTQKEKDRLAYAEKRRKMHQAEIDAEIRTKKLLADHRAAYPHLYPKPEPPKPDPKPDLKPDSENASTPGNANLPTSPPDASADESADASAVAPAKAEALAKEEASAKEDGNPSVTSPAPPSPTPPTHSSHSSHPSHLPPPHEKAIGHKEHKEHKN